MTSTSRGNGEEALSRIAQQEFDVVVSDIKMPGLNGLAVLERSRALKPNLSVILMTGYASLETAIEALRLGAIDYLRKPFELDDLTLSVERALRSHRAAERARPSLARGRGPAGRSARSGRRASPGRREPGDRRGARAHRALRARPRATC